MHKGESSPSFASRHRILFIVLLVWAIFWGAVVYAFYRFPYALDIFHFGATTAAIIEFSIIMLLISIGITTISTIVNAYAKDRKRVIFQTKPSPVVLDELFKRGVN